MTPRLDLRQKMKQVFGKQLKTNINRISVLRQSLHFSHSMLIMSSELDNITKRFYPLTFIILCIKLPMDFYKAYYKILKNWQNAVKFGDF